MRDQRRFLLNEHGDDASEHRRGVVDALVGGLAEGVRQGPGLLLQLVDDAAEQHGLALARVALDPEQVALGIVAPLQKLAVAEHPYVRVFEEPALGALDAGFVVPGIGAA